MPGRSPVARPSTEDSASAPARSGYRDSATARVRKVEGKNQYRVLQEAIGSDGRRWFRSGHDQVVDPDSGGDCDRLPRRLGLPTRTDSTC